MNKPDALAPLGIEAQLKKIFDRLHQTADFAEVDFSDINACATDGDNALHPIVRSGDIKAATVLMNCGN